MDRSNFKLAAAAMLLTVMLAGCGAQNGETTAAANGQAAVSPVNNTAAVQTPQRTADVLAKVVKVTADSILVQESTTAPADMPMGGGRGGGYRTGSKQGERSAAPADGEKQPADAAGGDQASSTASGTKPDSAPRRGAGGKGFQMEFKDEQTTIAINADTQIVTMSRGDNGMTTSTLKVSDIKEGDLLTIWLASDKKTAEYMVQRMNRNQGNFGKAGTKQ